MSTATTQDFNTQGRVDPQKLIEAAQRLEHQLQKEAEDRAKSRPQGATQNETKPQNAVRPETSSVSMAPSVTTERDIVVSKPMNVKRRNAFAAP